MNFNRNFPIIEVTRKAQAALEDHGAAERARRGGDECLEGGARA